MTRVYHYTSFEVLEKIFNSKSIWLTDSIYQNDGDNSKTFTRLMIEKIKKSTISDTLKSKLIMFFDAASRIESYYIWSASERKDYLPLWEKYGAKNYGIAIAFDVRQLATNKNEMSILSDDNLSSSTNRFFSNFYHPLDKLEIKTYLNNVQAFCIQNRLHPEMFSQQLAIFIHQYICIKYLNNYSLRQFGAVSARVKYIDEDCDITQHLCDILFMICSELTDDEINIFMSMYQGDCINILNLFTKDTFFETEEETRLAMYGLRSPNGPYLMTNNNAGFAARRNIGRYTSVEKSFEYIPLNINFNMIHEIVLGAHFTEDNYTKLKHMLNNEAFSHISITESKGRSLIRV